jgi:uncharacterized protein YecE (DUF72 family)
MSNDLENTRFLIGTSGWTYDDWKGLFYPEKLARTRWLEYYASQFHTVEINATFYGTFKDQTYIGWKNRVPSGFGYVLKAPRLITHRKLLLDVEDDIKTFYHSCTLLEDGFEMILLQVAPNTPYDLDRLQKALLAFPDPRRLAVEFRHKRWLNPDVEALLRSIGVTYCDVDSPRQSLTGLLTSDRAYLRMHGRKAWYAYNYSPEELAEIAAVARKLAEHGASHIYAFFNNDYNANAVNNAHLLIEMLGAG